MRYSSVRAGRRRPARIVNPFEALEDRTLFATVPSGFAYANYVTGLPECTSMTFAPDGRIFYTEKGGSVRVVKNGVKLSTPAVRVSVDGYFERGLQCITLDPQFATNGVFYLYYTKRPAWNANTAPNDAKNRISRFLPQHGQEDQSGQRRIDDQQQVHQCHYVRFSTFRSAKSLGKQRDFKMRHLGPGGRVTSNSPVSAACCEPHPGRQTWQTGRETKRMSPPIQFGNQTEPLLAASAVRARIVLKSTL